LRFLAVSRLPATQFIIFAALWLGLREEQGVRALMPVRWKEKAMPGLMGRLSAIFAVGMMIGMFGLLLLPSPPSADRLLIATTPIPDPPSPPCGLQTWPNIDRDCLSWTSARTAELSANEPARAAETSAAVAGSAKVAANADVASKPTGQPTPQVRRAPVRKAPRRTVNRNPIPVTIQRPDGTRQRVVIRPTSRQDFFFYAR
jgi:hypothetical protein